MIRILFQINQDIVTASRKVIIAFGKPFNLYVHSWQGFTVRAFIHHYYHDHHYRHYYSYKFSKNVDFISFFVFSGKPKTRLIIYQVDGLVTRNISFFFFFFVYSESRSTSEVSEMLFLPAL